MFVALLVAMLGCSPDETATETEAARELIVDVAEAARRRAASATRAGATNRPLSKRWVWCITTAYHHNRG